MKVLFLSNENGGFAEYVEIEEGTTVSEFLENRDLVATSYNIRVNREEVSSDHILLDGSRVTVTPTKIAGA